MSTHIALLSGGRDSTAMVFKMLENKMPLDYIIFSDTNQEFNEMYAYLDRVDARLKIFHGKELIRLSHKRGETFEDWCFGVLTRGKLKGFVRGLPKMTDSCYWKRESKIVPFDQWLKDYNIADPIIYIGYTNSEIKRSKVKAKNQRFPLITEFKMCEKEIDEYLESIHLVNPLYQFFERTGCAMCPYQKLRGYYVLWLKYNSVWEWMKKIENELITMEDNGIKVINSQWNIRYTMIELEKSYKSGEKLYEVEAPVACGCGI